MPKSLDKYARENSKYLMLTDGETFEGTYIGYKIVPSRFDPDKETVIYGLKYTTGETTNFQSSSTFVAKTLSKLSDGDTVKITRKGTGTNTKYTITSPALAVAPTPVAEPELQPDEDALPF